MCLCKMETTPIKSADPKDVHVHYSKEGPRTFKQSACIQLYIMGFSMVRLGFKPKKL